MIASPRLPPTASPSAGPTSIPVGKSVRSLPELVAERLLEGIITGRLKAGDRLKELALAQEHAVSRATIREALIALEKRRFVERIPRVGARVTGLGKDDVYELFEVRAALLAIAAHRCAENPSEAMLAELAELVADMAHLAADPETDPQQFSERSIRAQHLLLRESGNRYVEELYEQLAHMSTWRLVRGRALSFIRAERRQESARDWQAIAGAIGRRDPLAAERAARDMLQHSSEGVRLQLASNADREIP